MGREDDKKVGFQIEAFFEDFQLSLISCGYIFNFVPFDFSYYWAHYLIFIMENDIKAFRFLFYVTYLDKN